MWIVRSSCCSRFAGVFQQFQILRPMCSYFGVLGWHGLALTCLGSVWARCGAPRWADAHFSLLSFLQHVSSLSMLGLFTPLSRFCAPLQLFTEILLIFLPGQLQPISQIVNVDRSSFITSWKLKKGQCSGQLLSSNHTLACRHQFCHPSLAVPMPVLSLASWCIWLWAAWWDWECVKVDRLWGKEQFIICCYWILILKYQF